MTLRHPLLLSPALLLALAPLAVAAQDLPGPAPTPAPAPAPAPSSGVQGPPDGLITPPSPGQRPIPRFQPLPPPLPAPTPAPAPSPRPTPAPVSQQQPQARPQPRPAPALVPAPSTVPAPATPLPDFAPPPAGGDALPPETVPPTTVPAPLPDAAANTIPEWLPLAAIGGALALLGAAVLWWRRRSRPLALPAPGETIAAPPPVKPRPSTPAPSAARVVTNSLGRRADIALAFEPLSAQSTLVNLRMRYAISVTNNGVIDAATVAVRIGLFAGSGVNPAGIAQWISLDGETPHHGVATLAPGATHRFEGELAAPLEALNPMTVDGRKLAIPLVAVDVRYGHGAGEAPIEGQSARAFVIGREPAAKDGAPPATKLAPFRLDQGPTAFAPLGLRDTGIGKLA